MHSSARRLEDEALLHRDLAQFPQRAARVGDERPRLGANLRRRRARRLLRLARRRAGALEAPAPGDFARARKACAVGGVVDDRELVQRPVARHARLEELRLGALLAVGQRWRLFRQLGGNEAVVAQLFEQNRGGGGRRLRSLYRRTPVARRDLAANEDFGHEAWLMVEAGGVARNAVRRREPALLAELVEDGFCGLGDGAVAHGRCRQPMRRLQRYSRPPWQPIQLSASCLERSARQRRPEHEHGDAARMRSSRASSSSLARYR